MVELVPLVAAQQEPGPAHGPFGDGSVAAWIAEDLIDAPAGPGRVDEPGECLADRLPAACTRLWLCPGGR